MPLSDEYLRDLYNERRVEIEEHVDPKPDFSLYDIVGLTFERWHDIPTGRENPETLRAFHLSGECVLLIGVEGRYDDFAIHCFLIDKEGKDKYSEGQYLFNPRFSKHWRP